MVERSNLAQSFQDVSNSFLVSLSAMIWNHRELYPVSQLTHDEFLGHHQPAQVPRELCDGPVPLDAGDRALELSIEMMTASEFLDGIRWCSHSESTTKVTYTIICLHLLLVTPLHLHYWLGRHDCWHVDLGQ
jgi:hypothetical protein